MQNLLSKLHNYANAYRKPPYGREIEGTPELLEHAAEELKNKQDTINELEKKFVNGMSVIYTGQDESDDIECPVCHWSVAINEDDTDMRPKHCPECGTKLIY